MNAKLKRAIWVNFTANGEMTGEALRNAYREGFRNPKETMAKASEIQNQAKQKHLASKA